MTQTDQQKVPKLRFPGFEGDWDHVRIQELVDASIIISQMDGNHGELYPRSEEFAEEGVPYISANDFRLGKVDFGRSKKLPQARADSFKKGISKSGDLLFAHNATVGPTAILETDLDFVILSTTVTYYRFDEEKFSTNFAYHAFNTKDFIRQYSRVMSQSTRNQVPITTQRKFFLPKPSLPEQRKIADFLGAVDTKIAQLADKKRLLEDYKKGCMQQLFSQKIRFKDDDGKDFPDWEEKRLGDVFTWAGTNSFSRDRLTYEGGQVQNIHYGDIHTKFSANFHQDAEPVPYVKDAAPTDFNPEQFCQVGDVVIADASEDYADIGKAVEIVSLGDVPLVAGLHTYIARPCRTLVQTGFPGYLLRSDPMRRQIEQIAQGISVLGISKRNLEKLTFFLPHPAEQRKIADFLSALDRKIDLVGQELTHARSFKQGLLQQMFV